MKIGIHLMWSYLNWLDFGDMVSDLNLVHLSVWKCSNLYLENVRIYKSCALKF